MEALHHYRPALKNHPLKYKVKGDRYGTGTASCCADIQVGFCTSRSRQDPPSCQENRSPPQALQTTGASHLFYYEFCVRRDKGRCPVHRCSRCFLLGHHCCHRCSIWHRRAFRSRRLWAKLCQEAGKWLSMFFF